MASLGADPEQLEELAAFMANASGQMRHIESVLNFELNLARWLGPQAHAFQQRWSSTDRKAILGACGELDSASSALQRSANEQRNASAAGNGGSHRGFADEVAVWDDDARQFLDWLILLGVQITPDIVDLMGQLVDSGSLGAILGLLSFGFSMDKMNSYADGQHNFAVPHIWATAAETAGGLFMTLGGLLLQTPAAKLGAILLGVGAVSTGVGKGVNLLIDFWDTGGGRGLAHAAGSAISDAYRDTAAAVDRVWDNAYEGAGDLLGGAARGLGGLF